MTERETQGSSDHRGFEALEASLKSLVLAFVVWDRDLRCIQWHVGDRAQHEPPDDADILLRGTTGEFLRHRIEEVLQAGRPLEGVYLPVDTPPLWSSEITTGSFYPTRDESGEVTGVSMVVTRDAAQKNSAEQDEFRLMVQHAPDHSMFLLDPHGTVMCWNDAAHSMYGYAREEIIGQHYSLFYPSDEAATGAPDAKVEGATRVENMDQDSWRVRKDGTRFYANVVLTPLRQISVPRVLHITHDLTKRKLLTDKLQTYADRQHALADFSDKALGRALPQELMREAMRIVRETLGADRCAVYLLSPGHDRLTLRAGEGWGAGDIGRVSPPIDDTTLPGRVVMTGRPLVVEDTSNDDNTSLYFLRTVGLRSAVLVPMDLDDRRLGVIAAYRYDPGIFGSDDIYFMQGLGNALAGAMDRWNQDEQTRHQALHDPLTGLANRTLLEDHIEQALVSARRHKTSGSVLLIDLDNFKDINDQLGHHAGDAVLNEVGRRLSEVVRGTDTVARLGGDEFAVLLTDLTNPADAEAVADKILAEIRRPIALEHSEIQTDASIGIASYSQNEVDGTTLLQQADVAMYRAKRGGLGVARYEPDVDKVSTERLETLTELREAATRGALSLVYQPIIDLRTGEVTGMEAYVRWEHPRRGLLMPADFIPLAEQSGVMSELARWTLRTALGQCASWWSEGWKLPVTVNLCNQTFYEPSLSEDINDALEEFGLPGEALALDVSESSFTSSTVMATAAVESLDALGVRVCVDDFGTGFSSLAHISGLPLATIKIDRTFISQRAAGDSRAVIRSAIELAHGLNLDVIGEGIEDDTTASRLVEWGCDRGQGFGIARPMDAQSAMAWITERSTRSHR